MELNVNNLSVDSNGRVSFSGLNSNIDYQAVVDSIVAAKRVPVDILETQVSTNESKIAALGDLRTLLSTLKDSLSTLHGAVSVGDTSDAFENKEAFASSSRLDGATASSAANLIGVTVSNSAPVGSHSIEVLQVAKAHKVSSDQFSSLTSTVGFSNSDEITIEGVNISLSSTDTLQDVRDRINNANSGSSPTGVSATIVSVTASEHYLILTKDETGSDIAFTEVSGTGLQDLGIFTGGSAIKNELQASRKALMYADGILDQTNTLYESDFQTAATATPDTGGILTFTRDSDSAALGSIVYTDSDDLTAIAADITASITDVTASVVTDGNGVRLEITGAAGFSMSDSGGAITDLGIDNKRREIERDSNTVEDLFTGVTLSLFQAETGTTIDLDIERDLNQIKTSISEFVDAYNGLRQFINDQRTLDQEDDGDDTTVQSGLLFSSEALEQADAQLSAIIGGGVSGVSSQFSVLAQIGIDFIPLGSEDDPLNANTLEIDEPTLDEALLNNVEDLRRLFSFDFTPTDPRITMIGFEGTTTYNASGFTLNVQPNTGDNQFEYSEQFDNAYWSKTRSTISADSTTAPNGQTTADGLVGDATNNTHFITTASSIAVTADESYTYSVYAKQGANDSARIQLAGVNFPGESYIDVDLNAGTLTEEGLGIDGYSIEDAGDGWYRISLTATASATGNATMEMYSMNGINTVYTGDGATVDTYFYGAQLEDASTDSTHVDTFSTFRATTATSVTIDDPYNSGNFGATEIIASVDNADHGIFNTTAAAVTSGETYEFSAYLQQGDRTRARMTLNGSGFGASTNVDVNLNTGAITGTGAGADSATIEDVGNGWYRVTLTATATADASDITTEIRPSDEVTGLTFAGNGITASTYAYDLKLTPTSAHAPQSYVATTNAPVSGAVATANIDGDASGADDGSVTVANNVITIESGDAEGLQLFYSGLSFPTSISLDYTVGVGAQMFFAIEDLLDETTGQVETEIDGLTDTNEVTEDRITEMLARLEIQRQSLLERFIAMETAIATNNRILESLQSSAQALNNAQSS